MAINFNQQEMKLAGVLTQSLSAEASTSTITAQFFESDNKSSARTPDGSTLRYVIDPENTQGKISEVIECASNATSGGVTTLTTVVRGLQRDGTINLTGSATRAQDWDSGTPIAVATTPYNDNFTKAVYAGTQATKGNSFLIGDNTDSDMKLEVDNGDANNPFLMYDASENTWVQSVDGTSTTTIGAGDANSAGDGIDLVAGVISTDLDANGGLEINSTELAISNDDYVRFAADGGSNDTYVITLDPAATAYKTGQPYYFTANTLNTGAATLNINGLGAKSIVKGDSTALATGDIAAGQVVTVVYDGTNMVMTSLPDSLVAGGDAGGNHFHEEQDLARLTSRETYSINEMVTETFTSVTITDFGSSFQVVTASTDNNGGGLSSSTRVGSSTSSVHNKNPEFIVSVGFVAATAQEAFFGFVDTGMTGTSLENGAMTLDHIGFTVANGVVKGSVANGSTQSQTSDLSLTVTSEIEYRATFDGTTATFYINGSSVGTLATNVPDGTLTSFTTVVIADSSAAAKTMWVKKTGRFSYDEL